MAKDRDTLPGEALGAHHHAKKHDRVAVAIFSWGKDNRVTASSYASHPLINVTIGTFTQQIMDQYDFAQEPEDGRDL